MKLTIKTTKRFDKDLKKLKKRKYDLILLAQVINKLSDSVKNIEIIILLAIIKDLENVIFNLIGS